jgi:hypothetical protein
VKDWPDWADFPPELTGLTRQNSAIIREQVTSQIPTEVKLPREIVPLVIRNHKDARQLPRPAITSVTKVTLSCSAGEEHSSNEAEA